MLRLLPPQSPVAGRILDHVQGHTNFGRSRNFVHLVTGHTPGRINRNGTVIQVQAHVQSSTTLMTIVYQHLEEAGDLDGASFERWLRNVDAGVKTIESEAKL